LFAITNQNQSEQSFKLTERVTEQHQLTERVTEQHLPNHQDKCEKVVRFHLKPSLINHDDVDGIHGAEELA
jgi:hypothetical protein